MKFPLTPGMYFLQIRDYGLQINVQRTLLLCCYSVYLSLKVHLTGFDFLSYLNADMSNFQAISDESA